MTPCKEFREFCKACKHSKLFWNGSKNEVAQRHCGLLINRTGNPRIIFMEETRKDHINESVEDFNESLERRDAGMSLCPMLLEFRVANQ